jgi:anti-sigma regulatory factor (Ser/Thr protein kinase)
MLSGIPTTIFSRTGGSCMTPHPSEPRITKLALRNDFAELPRLTEETNRFLEDAAVHPRVAYTVNLVLEEMVTNVIKFSYDDQAVHTIDITLEEREGCVTVRIRDDGHEFNPLQAEEADTEQPLEDRPIGGLGIHLVREMATDIRYRREGGCNILEVDITPP